ncbi:hypothetical protein [Xenorhabdus ehlersii]|uniref:Lipoprotein n=1 Tax=Xenorhabdus ehlersii TaxID=290111 RepID=A0A2D0IP96_9GAMM|nr:hypothetical protein [Xenorhabdus ehlersii]PHM23697.1 hypothetical protein Xehl_02699 [Xenorhabdus ehlersii]RKE92699.1 hypothetical protein BDE27_0356 [Xenorhabdus ehlersii]
MMKKFFSAMICCLFLIGCDSSVEVFGITLGGDFDKLKKRELVEKIDLIPSKKHFILADLKKVPSPEAGDSANYFVQVIDGKIVSVAATVKDDSSSYYKNLSSYARSKLGESVATENSVTDSDAVKKIPYGCVREKSCLDTKYNVYRKGNVNSIISTSNGETKIQFDTDDLKSAL